MLSPVSSKHLNHCCSNTASNRLYTNHDEPLNHFRRLRREGENINDNKVIIFKLVSLLPLSLYIISLEINFYPIRLVSELQ